VKCDDRKCFPAMRTNLKQLLPPRGFLPPPVPFVCTATDPQPCTRASYDNGFFPALFNRLALRQLEPATPFGFLPFDYYLKSQSDEVVDKVRVCCVCKRYFPLKIACTCHLKLHAAERRTLREADEVASDAEVPAALVHSGAGPMPVVRYLYKALSTIPEDQNEWDWEYGDDEEF